MWETWECAVQRANRGDRPGKQTNLGKAQAWFASARWSSWRQSPAESGGLNGSSSSAATPNQQERNRQHHHHHPETSRPTGTLPPQTRNELCLRRPGTAVNVTAGQTVTKGQAVARHQATMSATSHAQVTVARAHERKKDTTAGRPRGHNHGRPTVAHGSPKSGRTANGHSPEPTMTAPFAGTTPRFDLTVGEQKPAPAVQRAARPAAGLPERAGTRDSWRRLIQCPLGSEARIASGPPHRWCSSTQ